MAKEPVNPKRFALDFLTRLPDNASLEDVREECELISGLLESIRDSEEGRTMSHEEFKAEFREWLGKSTGRARPAAT